MLVCILTSQNQQGKFLEEKLEYLQFRTKIQQQQQQKSERAGEKLISEVSEHGNLVEEIRVELCN